MFYLIFLGIAFVIGIIFIIRNRGKGYDFLADMADELKLETVYGMTNYSELKGTFSDQEIVFSYATRWHRNHEARCLNIDLCIPEYSGFHYSIRKDTLSAEEERGFGVDDILMNSEVFDKKIEIKGDNKAFLVSIVRHELRSFLLSPLLSCSFFQFTGGQIHFSIPWLVGGPMAKIEAIKLIKQLAFLNQFFYKNQSRERIAENLLYIIEHDPEFSVKANGIKTYLEIYGMDNALKSLFDTFINGNDTELKQLATQFRDKV